MLQHADPANYRNRAMSSQTTMQDPTCRDRNTQAKAPARKDISKDFPLRGFVTCGGCDRPVTSCWTKGRSKHYGYYHCQRKDCDMYGKSVRKEVIEGEFEELLRDIRPTEELFTVALAMFRDLWDERMQKRGEHAQSIEGKLKQTDRKIENLLDRIVDADNQNVVAAYEKRIQSLEDDKAVLQEKIEKCGCALPDFDESYRTTFKLLENPHGIWVSGGIEDKITALKLVFAERLQYDHKEGFRTASTSPPIRVLGEFEVIGSEMVRVKGLEPPRPKGART